MIGKGWTCLSVLQCYWRQITLFLTPVVFLPFLITFGAYTEARCAYTILIMAIYWMTEALPLPVTALIPIVAFPLLGVLSTQDVCNRYFIDPIFLFFGGIVLAIAVQTSYLDKRIAFFVLLRSGNNPRLLMGGFMLVTMFLSMWINNAAATAMILPTLKVILDELDEKYKPRRRLVIPKITITDMEQNEDKSFGELSEAFDEEYEEEDVENYEAELGVASADIFTRDSENPDANNAPKKLTVEFENLRRCMYLAVAYAANIGGTGVITGTPPNLILMGLLSNGFTEPTELNFASWMTFNIPGMVICTVLGWMWLQYLYIGLSSDCKESKRNKQNGDGYIKKIVKSKYDALGPMTFHEGTVLALSMLLIFLWVFRQPGNLPGWSLLFHSIYGDDIKISDTTSVILIVLLLFVIPPNLPTILSSKSPAPVPCDSCLTWKTVQAQVPWGIIILIGGGFAMAEGANKSNLSTWIGQEMRGLDALPTEVLVLIFTLAAVILTNVASNNATGAIMLPVLRELSLVLCSNPLYFMLPVTICCSFAFMLPVATPPNALVYYAGKLKTSEMVKAGFGMNIICLIVINILINTLGVSIFNLNEFPAWANSTTSNYTIECYANMTASEINLVNS